jgi:6-phosphogluconolactonase
MSRRWTRRWRWPAEGRTGALTRLTSCPDAETVAARAAAHVLREIEHAREQRGTAHLALSGGATPQLTYRLMSEQPQALDATEIWFADERCVAPDDPRSNYRVAAETLLEPAAIERQRVHRMPGELGPAAGAERYEDELREKFALPADAIPVLDVIVLGIGPDGHVASLFPGSGALSAGEGVLCMGVSDSPKPPPERITLSLAVLRAARGCLLLATGAAKADAVAAMLGEPTRHVPASLLRRERLTVVLDDAASSLRSPS